MTRIAIVGPTRVASELLDLLQGREGVEIAGIASRNPEASLPPAGELQELLRDSRLQLIIDLSDDPSVAAEVKTSDRSAVEIPLGNHVRVWSLRRESDLLLSLVRETVDGIFILDSEDRVIFWNRGAELLLGYRAEEIMGQPFSRLVPAERCGENKTIRELLARQGFVRDYESERLARDGTRVPVNISVTKAANENGRRGNLIGILRDVRESRRLARERDAYCRQLGTLQEICEIILNSADLTTVLEGILSKFLAVGPFDLGTIQLIDPEGEFKRTVAHRGYRDPENVKRHRKRVKDPGSGRLISKSMSYKSARIEENVPQCDGLRTMKREGVHSAIVVPVRAREDVLGVVQLGSRTPRKFSRSEVDLLEAMGRELGIGVQKARLYEEARRAYDKLKGTHDRLIQGERLRALGELASGVAHDFNNLLTAILGRTEVLLKKVEDPDLRKSLEVIQKATLDGASTVRRVQEFARVKNEEPHTAYVDLAAVIADAIEFTRSRWQKETRAAGFPVNVENECGGPLPVVGSPSQLREVFTNLILNAVDAMPRGGAIAFRPRTTGEGVVLEISDTGIGIPAEAQKSVFQPFFTTKNEKGTGLGLSIVEGIIQRHQGSIRFQSREGEGTTFTIELPSATPAGEGKFPAAPVEADPCGSMLVIDDESYVREILCDILEMEGHKPQGAASGAQGLAMLREGDYDLVLTDLKMSEMDGWEVARAVKNHHPDTPVILVSAWGMELTREQIEENGIDAVITKPFRSREIIDTVASLLAQRNRTNSGNT